MRDNPLSSPGQVQARLELIDHELANQQNGYESLAEDAHVAKGTVADLERKVKAKEAGIRLEQTGTVQERQDRTLRELVKTDEYREWVAADVNYHAKRAALDRARIAFEGRVERATIAQSILKSQGRS